MSEATSIGYWCSIAAQHYFARLQEKLADLEISNWFYVLLTIDEGQGQWSQQELADRLHLDKVGMTRALDHLAEKGYIERCDCTSDRRKHLVRLTEKAEPVLPRIRKAYRELNKEALPGLDAAERERFLQQLDGMVNTLRPVRTKARSVAKRIRS
ncbi:MAG TPA: MarR family transcriptional regulator [Flavobacteriales bacterium]